MAAVIAAFDINDLRDVWFVISCVFNASYVGISRFAFCIRLQLVA